MQKFIDSIIDSFRALIKVTAYSGPCSIKPHTQDNRLIIMANGPSLSETIASYLPTLQSADTLAVNFAANTPEFPLIKPKYYVLADPHFFTHNEQNFNDLWVNLNAANWPLTLIIPRKFRKIARRNLSNPNITLTTINAVGVEGFKWLRNFLYSKRLAMPRPRNVLIVAIMAAIWLGYKDITIVGADHSWTRTLAVDDSNRLIAKQKHFYAESQAEQSRVTTEYTGLRLHQILESLAIAFKSYHLIKDYASTHGIKILNATPLSYIDAFPRTKLQ